MAGFSPFSDDIVDLTGDVLGRQPLVDRMVQALNAAREDGRSSVVGLIGPWGSGKSSVLTMLHKSLEENNSSWQWVDFNPWYYADETSMQYGFFNELRSHMRAMGTDEANDAVRQVRESFGSLMKSSAPFIGAITGIVGVNTKDAVDKLGDLIGGEESITRAFEHAKEALEKLDVPFVVVLDDLDRLDPGELLLVARLVRLVGRLPNVHYVLAYDERTLIDLLQASPLVGRDSGRAGDYLEKIVQLRFDMPPLREKQIDDLVNENLDTIMSSLDLVVEDEVLQRFREIYDQALRERFQTMRSIKRYFAQVAMIEPGMLAELDFSDYLLMTWLRVEEPSVYHWLSANRGNVLNTAFEIGATQADQADTAKRRQQKLLSLLERSGIGEEDHDGVLDVLVALFPVIRSDRDAKPRQADRYRIVSDLRASSPDYFDRYFALEVPVEDIADVAVAAGTADLAAGIDASAAATQLQTAFLADPALVRRKLLVTPANAPSIARWMINAAQQEPQPTRWIGSLTSIAEHLLTTAIATTPSAELPELLTRLAAEPAHLTTLAQSCRGLLHSSSHSLGISEQDFDSVTASISATMLPILESHFAREDRDPIDGGTDLWVLIWFWEDLSGGGGPKAWIRAQVEAGRWDLIRTIGAIVPIGVSSNGTRSVTDPITRTQLDRYFNFHWLLEQIPHLDLDPATAADDSAAYSPGDHPLATEGLLEAMARATLRQFELL